MQFLSYSIHRKQSEFNACKLKPHNKKKLDKSLTISHSKLIPEKRYFFRSPSPQFYMRHFFSSFHSLMATDRDRFNLILMLNSRWRRLQQILATLCRPVPPVRFSERREDAKTAECVSFRCIINQFVFCVYVPAVHVPFTPSGPHY